MVIFITVVWIIILVILLILMIDVNLYFKYDGELSVKVGILGFKINITKKLEETAEDELEKQEEEEQSKEKQSVGEEHSEAEQSVGGEEQSVGEMDEKSAKKKNSKKGKKGKKDQQETKAKKPIEQVIKEIQAILDVVKSAIKPVGKILTGIRVKRTIIDIKVAGEEADKVAIQYGYMSTAVYNLLGFLKSNISMKIKRVTIKPDFVGNESEYFIQFNAKLRVIIVVMHVIDILIKIVKRQMKGLSVGSNGDK